MPLLENIVTNKHKSERGEAAYFNAGSNTPFVQ